MLGLIDRVPGTRTISGFWTVAQPANSNARRGMTSEILVIERSPILMNVQLMRGDSKLMNSIDKQKKAMKRIDRIITADI
jgi:hypothetical protein